MKIGIVGAGRVGTACALATIMRGFAREIVLVDRTRPRAVAVATDMRYGASLSARVDVRDGEYGDLAGSAVVMITAGVNEKAGGATDPTDPQGRLKLLGQNVPVYEEIVPHVVRAAPDAVLLVVSDPPDPLADLTRHLAGHDRVLSTGTYLDSLRFRLHLAQRLGVSPQSVTADVLGEHGKSEVFVWSTAQVEGVPIFDALTQRGIGHNDFKGALEADVSNANIAIIEGNDASQFGIGMVSARISEMIVRDEGAVIPIGSYSEKFGVTLSLPSIVGSRGVVQILEPQLSEEERKGLERSAATLKAALANAGVAV